MYGFGGESLGVGQSAILSEWFKGKEVAFAFGVSLSIARLGSVINNIMSPYLTQHVSITFALWFGAILCGNSVMCTLGISSVNKSFDLYLQRYKSIGDTTPLTDSPDGIPSGDGEQVANQDEEEGQEREDDSDSKKKKAASDVKFKDVLSFKHAFWILTISCVVVYGMLL